MITLGQLAVYLSAGLVEIDELQHHHMEEACRILEDSAKGAIGDPSYPFGWPPLSAATIAKHGNTPLLDTGAMQDSITHNVDPDGKEAYVGTDVEYAKYQEFGTSTIPARPFMGGALAVKEEEVKAVFGHGVVKALGPK